MCKEIGLHIDRNHQRQRHVCRKLEYIGVSVHKASDLQAARKLAKKQCYRVVMMYFERMGKEVLDFCRFIRSGSPYTIIVAMTSNITSTIEEKLFEGGVNDVVTGKQLGSRNLAKRIRAHLWYGSKPPLEQTDIIRLKDVVVNLDRREVWVNGTIRQLRGMQAELLKCFLDNPGKVISRKELITSPIWNDSICSPAEEGGRTFDVNMSKLRRVIEPEPKNPQIIKCVRGEGWILARDVLF